MVIQSLHYKITLINVICAFCQCPANGSFFLDLGVACEQFCFSAESSSLLLAPWLVLSQVLA